MQDFFTWSNQKSIILTFEAFKNRCLVYSNQLKKNRIRMLKSLSILEKMHPDNYWQLWRPDNLHSICLVDFTSSYVTKTAGNLPIQPDKIKSYIVQLSNIDDIRFNPNTIVLKNELGEMWKLSWPCVNRFH